MLIKNFRILWIRIKTTEKGRFRLTLPISLFAFEELIDCVHDLLTFLCLFSPKYKSGKPRPIHSAKEVVAMTSDIISIIADEEPYDIVDVTTETTSVSVSIR